MSVYIIELESVPTRYTCQWAKEIPQQLSDRGVKWVRVSGPDDIPDAVTEGAFLNFGGTNVWKSKQMENIARMFTDGLIKDGDYFLYTDAWNPTVIQLRYMAELLGIKIRIGGLWHAGSYDPQDFLGRLIGDTPWVRSAEHSMFSCYDDNFFATQFHIDLFANGIFDWDGGNGWNVETPQEANSTIQRVGWPMDYLENMLAPFQQEKENIVLFPHRIAPEKQVEIFKDLGKYFPDYEFIVCQEQTLTKDEYHTLLGKSKMVFSANLQETLGISCYEGALVGALPIVPDRLSYEEMYCDPFKYPSEWTESYEMYEKHKLALIAHMERMLEHYAYIANMHLGDLRQSLTENFFSGDKLYKTIIKTEEEHGQNNLGDGR